MRRDLQESSATATDMRLFRTASALLLAVACGAPQRSYAQQPPALQAAPEPVDPASVSTAAPLASPNPPVAPPSPARTPSFVADPVTDGALLSVGLGFGLLSEIILGTGEIVPQQPQDPSKLLAIDRRYVRHAPDAWATPASNVGFVATFAWAAAAPVLAWLEKDKDAAIIDAFIYAETLSLTWSATNLAKIAVRRPRPSAYRQQEELVAQYGKENTPAISDTNSALSFFSGHAAVTASVTATATYLAFVRSPKSARPWVTLGLGSLITAATSYGRVQGGHHFPTDVIAGAMIGAGLGVLVPHLHRAPSLQARHVWLSFAPEAGGGQFLLGGKL